MTTARFRIGFLLASILCLVTVGFADDNVGGSFSEQGTGTRAQGMGNAFVAIADDAYAMTANPAGLATIDRAIVTFEHADLFNLGLIKQSYFGAVFPTSWGTHGIFYRGLSFDFAPSPESANEMTLGYAYGRALGPLSLGAAVKYYDLTSDFNQANASGVGLDLGARYQATMRWSLGASIQNLYSNLTYGTGTDETIPPSWRLGTAYRISDRWIASAEYSGVSGDFFNRVRGGMEYWVMRPSFVTREIANRDSIFKASELTQYPFSLGLRAGVEKQLSGARLVLPAVGFTGGYDAVRLDYAFMFAGRGPGETHRFSLTYDFMPWAETMDTGANASADAATASVAADAVVNASPAGSRAIAVLDFANATGDQELGWLEMGLADIVAKELAATGQEILPRTALAGTANLAGPEIVTLARQVGARLAVRGVFVRTGGGRMALTLRIIDGVSGRTLDYVEAEAAETDIFSIGRSVGQGIAAKTAAWMP